MSSNGKWGKDPRGVEFVSFEMPYEPDNEEIEFEFTAPESEEELVAKVTNSKRILGIIILFEPNED